MSDTATFLRFTQEEGGDVWVSMPEISDISTSNSTRGSLLCMKSGSGYYVTETPEEIMDRMNEALKLINRSADQDPVSDFQEPGTVYPFGRQP